MVFICSGCVPHIYPLLEGTYYSEEEKANEYFTKAKYELSEITKEQYEEAKGVNVFIDASSRGSNTKRYLLFELYLFCVATDQYEQVTITNYEYNEGTRYFYDGYAKLQIGNNIYEGEVGGEFYFVGRAERADLGVFYGTDYDFSAMFNLEQETE